jgi:hypothetical protein
MFSSTQAFLASCVNLQHVNIFFHKPSSLWVYVRARLDILWKENIAFLWILENNFILMITNDFDFRRP